MTCKTCHGIGQGKGCPACHNATRAVFGLPPVHTDDGGHTVNGGVVFPIEEDSPITTPEEAGAWAVFAQVAFIAFAVLCLCFAFIQIVLPPLYH